MRAKNHADRSTETDKKAVLADRCWSRREIPMLVTDEDPVMDDPYCDEMEMTSRGRPMAGANGCYWVGIR